MYTRGVRVNTYVTDEHKDFVQQLVENRQWSKFVAKAIMVAKNPPIIMYDGKSIRTLEPNHKLEADYKKGKLNR